MPHNIYMSNNIEFYYRPASEVEVANTASALLQHSCNELGLKVEYENFAILAYKNEEMIASIIGKIFLDWLHIDLVWVKEEERNKGLGKQLILKTVICATNYGLSGIEVWTQSWQAPEFYSKQGFEEFAVIPDFIPSKSRYCLRYYLRQDARPQNEQKPLSEIIQDSIDGYFRMHGEDLPSSGIYDRLLPLFEKPLIDATLKATNGNQLKASKLLGINRNTLRKKLKNLV
jgi:DNA-binding protein Fis/N-acetylglutamate synthase-like GNAT family acetyltransferase